MKKLLIVLLVVGMLYACGAGQGEKPVENEGAADNSAAAGNTEATAVLVTVKKLAYEKFDHYFLANGSVEAVNDAFISPEINGQVKKILVKEGQRVKQGDLLVSLNSDVIRNSVAEVKTGLELAKTIFEKRKGLWEKKIGSEVEYLQAKSNKESLENRLKSLEAQLEMTNIKAPISGIVDEIFSKEGELAVPGMQLIRLVNLREVYVNADVSEAYLAKVRKGDAVHVTFPSYPGKTVDTVIYRTGNVVKPQNRTFLVQLKLDNRDEALKPNVLALIRMNDFSAPNALVVPSILIKNDLKGSYVYVVQKKDGKTLAQKTYITPGMSESGNTMVTEGLESGRQVIVDGYNMVKNGLEVNIKTKK
jgi:RND family efflux transporter MFP subunit